jgi:surface antigen
LIKRDILSTSINKTKSMQKQTLQSQVNPLWRRLTAAVLLFTLVSGSVIVHADQFDDQINAVKQQQASNQATLNSLTAQASSYQDAIGALQSQINGVQAAISANQAKQADLDTQIAANEQVIATKKDQLGASIKAMYIDGQISPIEQFASSNNISEYVDKEEYRSAVQGQLNATIKQIGDLQLQLAAQKQQVAQLIASQKAQNDQLAAAQYQQSQLLAYTEAQQNDYSSKIKSQNSEITSLRQQQAAENAKHFRGYTVVAGNNGNDTYPNVWRNNSQDTIVDSWGMYNRECVSYTAWKVASSGRNMPYWGGVGNANQWPGNARRAGIPVDGTPRAGDIAIAYWGSYGHSMYVESVNDDGTINVSQYNWDYNGHYSEIYHFSPSGLSFIHF